MITRLLTIGIAVFIFILVFELVRREKLTFKYALGWIVVSLLGVILSVFDRFIFTVAHFFGFELASNFIFFALWGVFIFLSLLMTVFLCQQNNRNDRMAQKIGQLEYEIDQLKRKNKENKP